MKNIQLARLRQLDSRINRRWLYTYGVVITMHGISPSCNKYLITDFLPNRKLCFITKTKRFMFLGHTITAADENQEKNIV